MPLYDFRCPKCGQVYEVMRPASRMAEPLLCANDQTPCERALSVPSFVTKGSSPFGTPPEGASTSDWSHFGHSHAPGEGGHQHGADDSL